MASDCLAAPEVMRSESITDRLRSRAAVIERVLSDLLPEPPGPERRVDAAMRYGALGGGKRLRGFLVMEGAALFGVNEAHSARAAAAVEMLHAYSLVHDDLPAMDDDDLRRGKPSAHRAFDEATAILAGDGLQTRAFEVLAEPGTHPDATARCELVLALARAVGARGMVGGQMLDMVSEGHDLPADEVRRLHALKTGRLIQFSAEAGAILGRAAAAERTALAEYGRDLGAAFQIIDDLLDSEGSAAETGKTTGKDAAAGKATLVSLLGTAGARAEAAALAGRAVAHLAPFGARADILRELTGYMTARRS